LAADYLSIQGGYLIEVGGDQGAGVDWRDGRQTERGDCQELDLSIYLYSGFSNALQDGATGLNELARISCTLTAKKSTAKSKTPGSKYEPGAPGTGSIRGPIERHETNWF
jgi:hypothetical protein